MYLEPKDLYEKLEFDKIIEILEAECLGVQAKAYMHKIQLETQKFILERRLVEVLEYKQSFEAKGHIPLAAYHELADDLKKLGVVDYVLPEDGLQRVNATLQIIRAIHKFFESSLNQKAYPNLLEIISTITVDAALMDAIDKVLDEKGQIRPDASPELMRIRKSIISKRGDLDKVFRKLIHEYRAKSWLSDTVESFRNGRRVLSVPSEHKRKIRGIIHDESATGKTTFLEPDPIIEINNDIFDLEKDEKREIYKILKELCQLLRPYISLIKKYHEILVRFDIIQAKAQLARRLDANMPKLKATPFIGMKKAFHPLLYLKNRKLGKKTIPFDLTFQGNNKILMLSGPNAGGKSVTMKAVGLLQLMLQAGMLVPVDEESEFGIFEKFCADIGDQQSLEDDLSTYSSRLKNMKQFVELADENTLILIDEFGSGTDPQAGGAIAEAILKDLNQKKVFGVITTHYSNLKMFAYKTNGIVNGAMVFNKDSLSPTYEMKVGRPGSSYAFEIAFKSGLPKKIINYAQHKSGKNARAVDQLLIDLQREKKEVEDQLDEMKTKQGKLEKLIKSYETLHKDLEYKRKKLKLEIKEKDLQQEQKKNKQFEKLIREIREEKNLEKARTLAAKVKEDRKELTDNVTNLKEEIYAKQAETIKDTRPIVVGDFVKLRSGGATGKVTSVSKKNAIITVGMISMTVKIRDLMLAKEPLDINTKKGVTTNMISSTASLESKIDLRGLRREEALKLLESFVDKAVMASSASLRIVHGKGDGILREAVKKKLREYKGVASIEHPEAKDGGDGVTIVEFV